MPSFPNGIASEARPNKRIIDRLTIAGIVRNLDTEKSFVKLFSFSILLKKESSMPIRTKKIMKSTSKTN